MEELKKITLNINLIKELLYFVDGDFEVLYHEKDLDPIMYGFAYIDIRIMREDEHFRVNFREEHEYNAYYLLMELIERLKTRHYTWGHVAGKSDVQRHVKSALGIMD